MNRVTYGLGIIGDPWILKTPPLGSEFEAWRDEDAEPPAVFVQVGKTRLSYQLRAIEDAHALLLAYGDWMPLGNADEGKPTKEGTLEHWARSQENRRRRVLWITKRVPRTFCQLHVPSSRNPGAGGIGTQPAKQSHKGFLGG